jgi:Sin3 binding region of histone deacetylase complex subunit SAP30
VRDAKHHARRKGAAVTEPSKHKDRERSSDRLKGIIASNVNSTHALAASGTSTSIGAEGKATHSQLASTIRRHFNSQQVSEGEVIAKFVYVVRHSGSAAKAGGTGAVGINGSKIIGVSASEADAGWEIGSSGREEDRRRDIGFRLRFKP